MADEHIETGFESTPPAQAVTVTVTEPEPLLPLDTAPAPLPANFSIPAAAALARDLAVNLYPVPEVLQKHNLTPEQLNTLNGNLFFQRLMEVAAVEWNSGKTMPQRLALEAQVLVEDAMPDIGARMRNKSEPLPGVVEAFKAITKVAGVGENKLPQIAGEKFTITINLGADTLKYNKTRPANGALEVQSQPEGDGANVPVQPLPDRR